MMDSSSDTRVESDKSGIVQMEVEEYDWRSISSKFKNSCCSNKYTLIPIILSVIALVLALGTIFGVAIRWHQMEEEISRLNVLIDTYEIKNSAASAIALAQKTEHTTPTSQGESGTTYIHWGKKTCGAGSSLVYSGFGAGSAAGTRTRGGGGAEYLCMPPNPEYNKYDSSNDSAAHSWLYSSEYMSFNIGIFPDSVHGHNVACSVCHSPRSAKTMIPARRTCPIGWTREYEGYLMSGYVTDMKTSYECVDAEPDVIGGTQNVTGGAALYFVSGYCGQFGGLSHCPSYITARELSCAICTK